MQNRTTLRLFISQPMADKTPEEIKQEREQIVKFYKSHYGDVELLGTYFEGKEDWTALDYLAESIKYLAKADLVVFTEGWQEARGCLIEHAVCEEYDIPYTDGTEDSTVLNPSWLSIYEEYDEEEHDEIF